MRITDLSVCSGCGACAAKCPKKAINFREDEYGRRIPDIDDGKCIQCEICVKTCPINHGFFKPKSAPEKCYALQAADKGKILGCSSGGVATVIGRYIIQKGGYVFGCRFDTAFDLNYVECGTVEELESIKGSKYVQSSLTECYPLIKKRLEQGKDVLITGLPCQIAGLRGYLQRQYDNLYMIDLICHGTPPLKYLKEHLKKFENKGAQRIRFRDERGFVFSLSDNSGNEIYSIKSKCDEYYAAFLEGLIYRENCYKCAYADTKRVSDITIGDFWGLNKKTLSKRFEGAVSVGIINTEKGAELFDEVKNLFIWEERLLAEALRENEQLRKPMEPDESDRKTFLKYYPALGFDGAVRKTDLYKKRVVRAQWKNSFLKTPVGHILKRIKGKIK